MKIVGATPALVDKFYNGTKMPFTSRSYFLLNDDGEPIATAGFVRRAKKEMILYTEGKDEVFRHKKEIIRFGRFILNIADEHDWKLVSSADESILTAHGFAIHFGFEPQDGGEYVRWPFRFGS